MRWARAPLFAATAGSQPWQRTGQPKPRVAGLTVKEQVNPHRPEHGLEQQQQRYLGRRNVGRAYGQCDEADGEDDSPLKNY